MMQRQFEIELDRLKQRVLTMAGLVEQSLDEVARALTARDAELARRVIERDDEIDNLEIAIDREATQIIMRHQPLATDLRFVIVAIKLGPELERIADNAVNIARNILEMRDRTPPRQIARMPRLLGLSRAMVTDAIAAYVARDAVAAREVIDRDDEVDELYWTLFHEMLETMIDDGASIERGLSLILIARYAERIADQATNIGEEIVYLVEGKPIRHGGGSHAVDTDGSKNEGDEHHGA
jgi:phosphate transport system protein